MKKWIYILSLSVLCFLNFPPTISFSTSEEWGLEVMDTSFFWNHQLKGKGVKIAIIDDGFDLHDDVEYKELISFVDDYQPTDNNTGHGTLIAGLIAAKHNDRGIDGVAPNVDLYGLKFTHCLSDCDTNEPHYLIYDTHYQSLVDAIDWCIEHDIDIINFSFQLIGGDFTYLQKAIDRAIEHDIIIVVPSGNDGTNSLQFPATHPNVVVVGSVHTNLVKKTLSNYHPNVDLVAPGTTLWSTFKNNGYKETFGTSMSSAYVTGMFALYKEAFPYLTSKKVKELVFRNALDLGDFGHDSFYGYGLIKTANLPFSFSNERFFYVTDEIFLYDEPNFSSPSTPLSWAFIQNKSSLSHIPLKKIPKWILVETSHGDKWVSFPSITQNPFSSYNDFFSYNYVNHGSLWFLDDYFSLHPFPLSN